MAAAGCGSGGNTTTSPTTEGGVVTPTSGPYQPLSVGSTWAYHVDDQGIVYEKDSSVEALEDVGGPKAGTMGYRVRETVKSSIQLTWYEPSATDVRRLHDQLKDGSGQLASDEWYDPFLLRVDEAPDHLQANATWTITYTDTKTTATKPTATVSHTESWHVDGVDTPVTVPAGTFAALQVTRTDSADSSTKTQWFVRGVGKVRESTGAGHTEELTSYNIAK
jgi:hypothetical protein